MRDTQLLSKTCGYTQEEEGGRSGWGRLEEDGDATAVMTGRREAGPCGDLARVHVVSNRFSYPLSLLITGPSRVSQWVIQASLWDFMSTSFHSLP